MKKMKRMFAVITAIIMALSLTACNNNAEITKSDSTAPQVESIEITDIEINTTDKDVVIEYTLLPEGAEAEVVMEIADTAIATVDEGKITAVAEGETELTVSADEITATVKVTVTETEENPVDSEEDETDSKEDASSKEPVESTKPTETTKPVSTSTPVPTATPTPTAKPTATPTPTAKPTEAPKCGAVGHSADGTCSVCGSTYTTPKCGAVGHSVDGTCSVCGSTYTTPKCGAVGHSADGTCSVCGSSYTTPVTTCPVCGSAEHTTHPALDNNQNVGDTHNPGDNGAGDEIVD